MDPTSLSSTRFGEGGGLLTVLAGALLVVILTGGPAATTELGPAAVPPGQTPDPGSVVDVTSTGMNLDVPAEIPAGWTTFRFRNRADVTHFFVLEKLPAGKTVADSRAEVVPVFQDAMDLIVAGDAPAGFAEFERLPAWFADVTFVGGPGLTAPGHTARTTVRLEPGTYVLECYVKTPDGKFHSAVGMITGLTVTGGDAGAAEPDADVHITLANDGMTLRGSPRAGEQTFAVRFDEQTVHENAVGHDVHLARLGDGVDPEDVAAWMSWATPDGLTTPAPAEFLGGTQELPAGRSAYFTARLEPGRYALVAEVPDPIAKDMLVTFTVNP